MFENLLTLLPVNYHMWVVFAFIVAAITMFVTEKLSIEMASLWLLLGLLLFFYFFPYMQENGKIFSPDKLLAGFSNPALVAVLALLVLGQAVVDTGSLNAITNFIFRLFGKRGMFAIALTLFGVIVISAFVNDTPTCVVFMPIMMALAHKVNLSASRVMIPLSYASILGGTITLIGSSTNLVVSSTLPTLGLEPLGMFDFTIPGLLIAFAGFIYIGFVLPRLLPDRAPLSSEVVGDAIRQFVVQLEVDPGSELVGKSVTDEKLLGVDEITVKMLQRYEHAYLAPFEEPLVIRPFDVLVITTTKQSLVKLLSEQDKRMFGKIAALNAMTAEEGEGRAETLALAEVLIAPGSRMVGQSVEQVGFYHNYHCTVVGIQRRTRMITARMTESRLAAGDVLMVMGTREHIEAMRGSRDLMLMEWSTHELPSRRNARSVNLIFGLVVLCSAFDVIPIHIGALAGALLVLATGCLTSRQAVRALDAQIILLVAAGIALASSLEVTGGAAYLAKALVGAMDGAHPVWVMSALFGLMAVTTNVLSNNATGLLYTPIAVNAARELNVDPAMFIHAVIFASNCCSFATPIGYQTNLLVMGPGHYVFKDYMKAGIPLCLIVWATFTAFAFMWY